MRREASSDDEQVETDRVATVDDMAGYGFPSSDDEEESV
jgi:hypothetical protein